ncbi:MAG TPA: hypothetical protein VFE28_01075 [Candidatus Krumholzibacteria bacterium]|jgi:hypothetical protein|nr:hypothetical protein [Candidatus Krumholzibacteria bacterium]
MKHLLQIGVVALALVVGAGNAAAQLSVQLSFDRAVAHPGDTVTLSGSVSNTHDLAVFAYMSATVFLNGAPLNSFSGRVPLEPGESISSSLSFDVPSLLPGGSLMIELRGRACDGSTIASTSIVLERSVVASGDAALRSLGKDLLRGFGLEVTPTAVKTSTMGNIKSLYR